MGDVKTIMIRIGADGKAAIAGIDGVQSGLKNLQPTVNSLTKDLAQFASGAAAFALMSTAIKSSIAAMSQAEKASIGLAVTARFAGEDINRVTLAAKALASDGLMSAVEASQALQNLLSRGYTLQQSIDMMNRLKDSAAFNRQSHLEFGQAIVGATEGLKNENSVLVDNAGVTKNVSIMWKEYAAQHSKSVDSLTQAEKRQAEYNGIMRETEGQIGNAVRMTKTFQGAQARLAQETFVTKAAFGEALTPALLEIAKALVPVARGFRDFIGLFQSGVVGIAAFIDKAMAVYNKGGLIGLLFSSEKRKSLAQEFAIINKAAEDQKQEIFDKLNMPQIPDIGADNGKRRKDTVMPDDKAKKKAEAAAKTAREVSAVLESARERDLLIGKQKDEQELIRLDTRHRQELKRLTDLKAATSRVEELHDIQQKERGDLLAKQKEDREYRLAATAAKTAEAEFQAKAQWLDKLEQYQVKTGQMDSSDALANSSERQRELLLLKLRSLEVDISHEKEQSKINELDSEYWRISEQITQSKEQQIWAEQELLQKSMQASYNHQANMTNIEQLAIESRLQFIGQEQAALEAHYAWKDQQLLDRYLWEMENLTLSYEERLAKEREYQEQHAQIQAEYSQRQVEQYWANAQTYMNFAQQMSTMGIQMMLVEENQRGQIGKRMLATAVRFMAQQLQQFMFMKAKEHLLAAFSAQGKTTMEATAALSSLSMLETQAAAYAAFYVANSLNPYGGQAFIPAATAMTAVAGGVVPTAMGAVGAEAATTFATEMGLAAAWAAGGILVGALGEAAASSIEGSSGGSSQYGAGTTSSPIVTTGATSSDTATAASPAAAQPVIHVNIYGNVVDHDQFAREMTDALRKAYKDAA